MHKVLSAMIRWWSGSSVYRFVEARIDRYFRSRLENDEFTILCPNCIGGAIYHRLGKQFLSPTVNLYMSQQDYIELCVHLEHYLRQKIRFVPSSEGYPIGILPGDTEQIPDILLRFNHYHSEQEAEEKWEARKQRIRRDNLYLICYNWDVSNLEQWKRLDAVPCKNRVLLTGEPLPEISWSHYIKPVKYHKYSTIFMQKNLFGLRYYEKKFDFVEFLNKK